MKNGTKLIIGALASLFLFAGSANAHVTVNPSSSAPEAWETYTLKVPVEKESSTTKVALKVPEGITFSSYQPVPDWKVTTEKDKKGHVKTVTWEATGDGIAAGQFQQFTFVAQNPKDEADIAWDAFQYYADGEIVEWSGEEGSDLPHSITEIMAASKSNEDSSVHEHAKEGDHSHSDSVDKSKESTDKEENNDQTLIIILGLLSLIISIIALTIAARKNKK
ncbi:YcnI family protein [Peribacillus sp. NPDC097225]|uniref:YcnI family copper-binding membrane protein n=1 Tax=Peribacillus sp. NPDC097225 TaxID=3364400 RepID=UPI0037F49904